MRRLCCFARLPLMNLVAALLFTLSTGANAQQHSTSASAYYENAVKYYNAEKYDEAVVELKNALQVNPRLLPAMVMLGQAYLQTGNPAAAETALNDATAAGADPALVVVPLAKAYVMQFKQELLLAEEVNSQLPATVRARLHVVRARAAVEINAREKITQEIALAEALDPVNPELLAVKVTVSLRAGDLAQADSLAKQMLQRYPDRADTWLSIASVRHIRGDFSGALKNYAKALEIEPENSSALIARIGLLLDLGRDEETTSDFSTLGGAGTVDPRVNYLRSIKLARAGDQHGSRQALNEVINVIDLLGPEVVNRNTQLLMTAGFASYALNNLESARNYFEIYIEIAGKEQAPLEQLATIYLQQQAYRSAIDLLEDIAAAFPNDIAILSKLAQAYEGVGDAPRAMAVLERATSIRQGNPRLQTQLAISRLQAGFPTRGINDLRKVFGLDESQALAGLPLAVALLQRGDYEGALDVAKKLSSAAPNELTYKNIMGIALVGMGDLPAAKTLFEFMLTIDPDSPAAFINLAKIERRTGHYDKAESILQDLLQTRPDDPQLMVELSRLELTRGEPDVALRWARNAALHGKDTFEIQKYLIELLVKLGDPAAALKVALEQDSVHPDDYRVQQALVNTQLAAGESAQASSILRAMASNAKYNAEKLKEIGRLQIAAGAIEEASYTLFKALQGNPAHFDARVLLTEAEIKLGRLDEAFSRAAGLKQDYPALPVGFRLAGDVLMRRGHYVEAASEFKRGLELSPNNHFVILLHLAQRAIPDLSAAEKSLLTWLSDNPKDLFVRNALAELYLGTGAYDNAKREYDVLVSERPKDARILNNMANLLYKMNDLETALSSAQKALSLAPENAMINDTVGWLLVRQQRYDEGIGYLREALTRDAANPEIRYHLAAALHGLGRNKEAIQALSSVLATQHSFEGRIEAEALFEKLHI